MFLNGRCIGSPTELVMVRVPRLGNIYETSIACIVGICVSWVLSTSSKHAFVIWFVVVFNKCSIDCILLWLLFLFWYSTILSSTSHCCHKYAIKHVCDDSCVSSTNGKTYPGLPTLYPEERPLAGWGGEMGAGRVEQGKSGMGGVGSAEEASTISCPPSQTSQLYMELFDLHQQISWRRSW